ncbi:hypothetical protein FRB90_001226 [Tulasnella sp. 427]|nr:hypothetical protein FRB90_001226 [Tulasnella sp. 427]
MFGRPEHGPLFRGEPTASDAMQVDQPLTTAQPGRSNGVDAQDPARGRRLLPQVSGENGAESFASAWGEVRRIVAELDQAGSFRTFTSGDMLTLIHDLHQVEANTEPAVGWWQSFTARRAEETPSEKTQPRANPPRKSSSRYRSGNRAGDSVQSQGGTVATEGPQSVLYDDSDIFDAMQTFAGWDASELLNEEQPLLTRFDAVLETSVPRESAANPALQGRDGLSWTLWTQENWDIIAAGAIILGNQVAGVDKSPTESDPSCLSKRGEPHTSTDYDEVSDFVTTQIKARELVEGGETIVISKEFFWKAFAILHKADRSWNDWQGYYITNAGDINRSARTRLKLQRERDLTSETAVILESEQYNSSPLLSLKRPYEGASDDRAPKQLRA